MSDSVKTRLFQQTARALLAAVVLMTPVWAQARTVRYELSISRHDVNLSGKKSVDFALMVNGSIPAPTLYFTEGDDAEILVTNRLDSEEVSLHWHGILLPPEEDGVAYINTPPIFPGQSRLFRFRIRQHGTYWYHSHTTVQEQKGVYGAIVIQPKKPLVRADRDVVAVLSDWSDENANQIIQNLRKDGDYYLYKKDSIRSIGGALRAGKLGTYLRNEWDRMGGMDLSDVGYDAFLINGKRDSILSDARPGERVRVRIINAGASSYFYVSLGGLPMTVISADGIDIQPIETQEILMGMAETYDILFTVPDAKSYELRATVQDVTGFASAWIGSGPKQGAVAPPLPDLYAEMNHGTEHDAHAGHGAKADSDAHAGHGAHAGHDAHAGHRAQPAPAAMLTVDSIRSHHPTTLPASARVTDLKLVLGGDMERYVWHINGKAIHQDRDILINEGDVVRFTFVNETMMHHPMHLHGHFFRVLNEGGPLSPLKHTVDVPPHGTRTIEFYANEPGQWMLHCHNLYHMKTGMARVVKYMSYKPSPEMAMHEKHDPHLHEHLYWTGTFKLATQQAEGRFRVLRTWDELELRAESRNDSSEHFRPRGNWDFEGDLFYRRWFGSFLSVHGGGSWFEERGYALAGVGYVLPMLIEAQASVSHRGGLRFDLEKRFQWTSSVFTEAEFTWRPSWGQRWESTHDTEFAVSLMYGPSWHWAVGLNWTSDSLGAGAQFRF